jgi:thioredoxin reductase (NADPH)
MKDLIVIGAGTAGLTAALYAARAGKSVLIFEKEGIGGQIATTPIVENYPGIQSISGIEFADGLYEQVLALGVELEVDEVLKIEPQKDHHKVISSTKEYVSKAVIIATGSKPRLLGLSREQELTGRGVSYCALCDGLFFKKKSVVVVGGGNTAITEAIYLSTYAEKVTVIHRRDVFTADLNLMKQAQEKSNIFWKHNTVIKELIGAPSLSALTLENTKTQESENFSVDGLFVAIGQIPQTEYFKDLVPIDSEGFFEIGEDCQTQIPGLFVAGDCRKKAMRQLTTAVADGANASKAVY